VDLIFLSFNASSKNLMFRRYKGCSDTVPSFFIVTFTASISCLGSTKASNASRTPKSWGLAKALAFLFLVVVDDDDDEEEEEEEEEEEDEAEARDDAAAGLVDVGFDCLFFNLLFLRIASALTGFMVLWFLI
jgi:hypothetical protein